MHSDMLLCKAKTLIWDRSPEESKWVEGVLHYAGVSRIPCILTTDNKENWSRCYFDIAIPIAIKTLCRFTGITDKNGNKIFENDIVAHRFVDYNTVKFPSQKLVKNYFVKWDNTTSYCGFRYHNGRNIFPFKKGTVLNGDDVVVGNIFDNPELLKEPAAVLKLEPNSLDELFSNMEYDTERD